MKVASVGGIRPAWMPSQRVRIVGRSGIVHGVVGTLSSDNKDPKMEDLFIDIGAKDKEDALKWVELGDPIVVGHDWQELDNGLVTARNFDNRVGCYIVAEVMRRLSERESVPVTVLGVSATQEETGGIGAGQVANRWKPTVGIAFDVTWASDYPSTNQALIGDVKLGGGPVLIRGVRTSQRLYEQLRATAERHDIPWQVETETGRTSTDADSISTQHGGIPVTVISIPTRYMHSSCEVISLNDVEQIIDLTVAYLTEYGTA
ncbi:MAG: M20/M25/M40 family metallo-hydrolase [Candidatus Poribacteria bacterium]|nr:M20/M25/M40 family metallo-hydrolase [Candidatus Poribacteria bacterium]